MTTNNKILIGVVLFILGGMGVATVWMQTQNQETHTDWEEHGQEIKDLKATLQSLADQIKALRGRGACEEDSDCHALGIGAKTCDGYNDFLVYSIRDAREEKFLERLSEFNIKAERLNVVSFKVEKCGTKPPPVQCFKSVCRMLANSSN